MNVKTEVYSIEFDQSKWTKEQQQQMLQQYGLKNEYKKKNSVSLEGWEIYQQKKTKERNLQDFQKINLDKYDGVRFAGQILKIKQKGKTRGKHSINNEHRKKCEQCSGKGFQQQ